MANNQRTYIARADSGDLCYTENENPKPYVIVQFIIEEGERAGTTLPWYGYFTEKTEANTMKSLRVCGWSGNDLSDLSGISDNLVQIVVADEEYNGQIREKVRWVNKFGSMAVKGKMTDEQKKQFAQRMRGLAMSLPAEKEQTTITNISSDDLPF
jgi:hypothetical protein